MPWLIKYLLPEAREHDIRSVTHVTLLSRYCHAICHAEREATSVTDVTKAM
jgi:hypothetical protein